MCKVKVMHKLIQSYMSSVTDDRKPLFDKLQTIITGLYPSAGVLIWYKLLTFRKDTGWVVLGYWKSGISVYTGCKEKIAKFKADNSGFKTDAGCINFKVNDEIPEEALEEVIRYAIEYTKKG